MFTFLDVDVTNMMTRPTSELMTMLVWSDNSIEELYTLLIFNTKPFKSECQVHYR